MAQLPTKENLIELYKDKGSDALVWYAWRNVLRALPLLGSIPIKQVWQQNEVRHVFALCRVCLVLAQWGNTSRHYAAKISAANAVEAINAATAAIDIATAVADVGEAAFTSAFAPAVSAITSARVAFSASAATTVVIDQAAVADYQLIQQQKAFNPAWWYGQPLWHSALAREPAEVIKWRQVFDSDLRKLGLSFLADDLSDLWENNPLGVHATNYLKEFSNVELNDSDALVRLIKEGGVVEHIHAVRVLLLGPGGAGKSSLADRLQGEAVELGKKLTVGVDYLKHQALDLYSTFDYLHPSDKPLDLYLWDFGGQTIFHGLHSAFLHENCVYVLVVDSRHEQAPDEWLYQIRHLAGKRANVLLVTNWYEACETRQNEARLLREFPDLLRQGGFFYFSCVNPDAPGLQDFVRVLEQTCLDSQRMVLKETVEVNEALQLLYQHNVFLESGDLDNLIAEVTGSPAAVETLPNKLEQLGFLVRVDSNDQRYCLQPAWVIDHAYHVLYSSKLREARGVLTLKDLQELLKEKVEPKHVAYLIEFLEMRSLCRKLRTGRPKTGRIKSSDGYFFPDAAPADEVPEANALLNANSKGLTIRFDLPYLPLGFHTGLVSRLFGVRITNEQEIWRKGFILRRNLSQAIVHYLSRKSVIEMVLFGGWIDFPDLLNTLLVNMKAVLAEGEDGIREEQIHPSVVLGQHVFSVHSAERLVRVLGQINDHPQLVEEIKAMASKINVNVGDGSQVAIDAHNVTQKYNSDNTTLEINADQRQQIAAIIGSLLKDAGSLDPESLMAVAEVNKALAAPQDKPEARNLLGKVWNGLKEVVDVTKTGTDIAGFVLEHQTAIAGAITTAVALLK